MIFFLNFKIYLDVKMPKQFPCFRPYQKAWFAYDTRQSSIPSHFKPIKSQKFNNQSSNLPIISTLSIPNTIETISTDDTDNINTISSASILSVA